jgi:hypothetical protein
VERTIEKQTVKRTPRSLFTTTYDHRSYLLLDAGVVHFVFYLPKLRFKPPNGERYLLVGGCG